MLVGSYDGTFAGLLTLCAELFRRDLVPEAIRTPGEDDKGLFDEILAVQTDEERAERFSHRIEERAGKEALRTAYHAFLSGAPDVAILLYRYLSFGRRVGRSLNSHLSHEDVLPVLRLARQVRHEAHRMLGFVRFAEIEEGLYYAAVETDFFILPLIGNHFADRFASQKWIIHDRRRGQALLGEGGAAMLVDLALTAEPGETAGEERFRSMWQGYFDAIAVSERLNLRLQGAKVPKRYRNLLPEFGVRSGRGNDDGKGG